jgi:FkbM family methyltransferase
MNLRTKFLHRLRLVFQIMQGKLRAEVDGEPRVKQHNADPMPRRDLGDPESNVSKVWIDVGAHHGEKTLKFAQENPSLIVYAFEPNFEVAASLIGLLPNFVMIPSAVAEQDGCSDFYINTFRAASSLFPFNAERLQNWTGGEQLTIERKVSVPAIRLDTFMDLMRISHVDYLKIDAQGADFSVVKSAGTRLRDIRKITLEVAVTASQLYVGASTKEEIVKFMEKSGFVLVDTEAQSYDQEENLTFIRGE